MQLLTICTDNNISETGVSSLLSVIRYQSSVFTSPGSTGVLSLSLHHNSLSPSSAVLTELEQLLQQRNPVIKSEEQPPDDVILEDTPETLNT